MRHKERLETYLRENRVEFQVQPHPPAYTAQEVAATEHVPGRMFAKVVMAMVNGNLTMLVLQAPDAVDLQKVANALGANEVRLAAEDEFAPRFPDCEVGAMPPFGTLYNLPVYVDPALAENENIVFEAGAHTVTMLMKYADFERLVQPKVVGLTNRTG